MRTTGKKLLCYLPRNSSFLMEINSKLSPSPKSKKARQILKKSCSSKLHSCTTRIEKKNDSPGKVIENMRKISIRSCGRSQSSLKFMGKKISCDGAIGGTDGRKRQKRKKKRNNIVQDEASCLQRRARYLLIKMKLELSLIDAYSGDGWKGQSKEKIKPEKELQRAGKQVLNCKLGIRDTIRQLDLLSSEGRIADSVMYPDGSVFHEHIFCAKCKSREAFPDNDIILCDGTCNCAFHQKCLEPPLDKIPPADQGWLCKICDCKTEILEAINAHIGTSFAVNSSWEDIFKEANAGPNTENTSHNPDGEWPSEDSNDKDYDPELIENNNNKTVIEESMSDDASSSSGLFCSSDEVRLCSSLSNYQGLDVKIKSKKGFEPVDSVISIDSGECSDHEITSYRRQRRDVDYKKLYNEMFGKELNDDEQQSEDEDWGPQRRKRRRRELNAGSMMATCRDKDGCSNTAVHENVSHDKRKLFRIPHDAVEKLRHVFAKNELPSRAVKENLSLELGISAEKISKWFKNARYAALKMRKVGMMKEPQIVDMTKGSIRKVGKKEFDREEAMDGSYLLPLSSFIRVPKNLRKILQRKNSSISTPLKTQRKGADNALPTNKIQKLRSVVAENQFPSISVKKNLATELGLPYRQVCMLFKDTAQDKMEVNSIGRNSPSEDTFCNEGNTDPQLNEITVNEQMYLVEIERLFSLGDRLRNLKNTLLTCKDSGLVPHKAHPKEPTVIYVPVAVVKEKPRNSTSGLM